MTFHPLRCHAAGNPPPGIAIAVAADWQANGDLRLGYRLSGPVARLRIPEAARPEACDGLWQHTCCEAFVSASDAAAYREFNFAPSGQWAIYDFAAYRQRNEDWQASAAPLIDCWHDAGALLVQADIPRHVLPPGETWQIGLTAVLETLTGDKSYWALLHPDRQPDFHRRAGFTLTVNQP